MNELTSAIESDDIAATKSLLAGGSVDVNGRIADAYNSPLLVLAAELGRVEIVAHLLDAGAQIDDVDDFGESACHAAVLNGHRAVVELLVARNANLALRNRRDETPIEIAISMRNEGMLMLLIDAAIAAGTPLDKETACHAAAVSTDVIRLLRFKYGINLSAIRDTLGRTPLHQAVSRTSDAGVLKMLIEAAGIDVDVHDNFGNTAAHIASSMSNEGALTCLVAAGANLDLTNIGGDTPLHRSL